MGMKTKDIPHEGCDNCKHFIMHYVRNTYNYGVAIGCGECRMKKYTEEERARLPYGFVCDTWALKECGDTDVSEIKEELRDITARLILIVKALAR